MTIFNNSTLTTQDFLNEYWQQKPLLIRAAFPEFQPPLDADDIAGLACEELAESRLVTGNFEQQNWAVRHGPFSETDFNGLPDQDWTLLVQDVEKHYPPLQELMDEFNFIPRWRFDDLMVSVAGPGGSVGPHVDQYDVFLLQASGSRRWEIAETFDPELLPDCELKVLRRFGSEQSWLLHPGDLLYLPPGTAHHGVAEAEGMTWSIGMRAPSAADLVLALGEWLADQMDEGGRYRDSRLSARPTPGEIDDVAIFRLSEFINRPHLADFEDASFLGRFLSRYRIAHEPAPPTEPLDSITLVNWLDRGNTLRHNPWTRLLWVASADGARLFAAGAEYSCDAEFARIVCDPARLSRLTGSLPGKQTDLLCELVNRGHLYFQQL